MVNFERFRERKGKKGKGRRDDNSRGRNNNFDKRDNNKKQSNRNGSSRRKRPEMTTVTCDSCGEECEVPFRPSSDKPVYCSDCFDKKGKRNRSRGRPKDDSPGRGPSERDIDVINEKLNKIMKALHIE